MRKLHAISRFLRKVSVFNSIGLIRKVSLVSLVLFLSGYDLFSQSVIEMTDPADAEIVLLEVDKKENADIIVYKTRKKRESKQWDCMWRFRKWGFSDLSMFIFTNIADTAKYKDEDSPYKIDGKVFFTQNKNERGYKDPNFRIEGIIRRFNNVPEENDSVKKSLPIEYFVNVSGNITYLDFPKTKPEGLKVSILDSSLSKTIFSFSPESEIFTKKIQVDKGWYNITIDANGYEQKVEHLFVSENDTALMYSLNAQMNPMAPLANSVDQTSQKELVVSKLFFFEFNSTIINQDSQADLDNLTGIMIDNPSVKIELVGYADSKGSDVYNEKLSLQRSKAVEQYLSTKGISKERMKSTSKGEKNPIAINSYPDNTDCPEGRKFNRRVEIKLSNLESVNIRIKEIEIPSELRFSGK